METPGREPGDDDKPGDDRKPGDDGPDEGAAKLDEDAERRRIGDPPPRRTPTLRVHLQGTFLLIVLLLVLWAVLDWAGPVISNALSGPDGAVVAKAPAESEAASDDGAESEPDEPLGGDEVAELQAVLARFGYDPGPVDGILGDLTRSAAEAAKADLNLSAASDRRLLNTLAAAIEALDEASTGPDS